MTKFEEELFNKVKVTNIELTTEAEYKKSTLINHFKNWHSDEEFQELKEQNENQAESILLMLDEIKSHKSQLQQQALPVVPEDIAEWIEILKTKGLKPLKNPETYGETGFTEEKLQNIVFWISEHQEDYMRAWLDGYTVEKPQLFEVKMPIVYWDDDASQLTNGFDFLRIDKETDEVDFVGFLSNTKKHTVHFTEQEIKSIDERYWQFAVPVEDGE
ncbi:DUF1642 domain-containing protein [Lactococcus cremoris]|uniref:DUF1642 domain-containing protein n=1 Tax=Lactococcus lactis subsp. cremoris TaxID=1359 RepID=UPI0022E5E77F|nr:DUF1642 domain-containing protein [Lactococcus cremoris]MDA2881607.1 DUF1642 domain-containing protein [Lactococcus cremoris]MDA2884132.1 DUF1642 domain-containing protein [Lactococcus cremoris]